MYIRVWQSCNVEEISKCLLIVGDVSADCSNCRELGIEYSKAKNCPKCGTTFHFITSRNAGRLDPGRGGTVKRIKDRRADLTFIDYEDFKEITGKQQARNFFST